MSENQDAPEAQNEALAEVQKAECRRQDELGRYRRKGNVAQLPKAVRDRINGMIEDGLTYGEIIERLGEDGKELDPSNLTRWRQGGYQDWLAERAFIERTRMRQETPGELVRGFDGTQVNQAALQLGTLHIFEALRELGPETLSKKLGGDCAAFARLINALARASRETMQLQKYHDACAKARLALRPMKDPRRKLTQSEARAIVERVDELLGLNIEPRDPYEFDPRKRRPEPEVPPTGDKRQGLTGDTENGDRPLN